MAGMSLLRPCLRQGFRLAFINGKPVINTLQKKAQLQGQVSVRNAGHEKKIPMVPSNFEWNRFKDDLHFYLFLGFVPMFSFITLVNIFIGPADLSDTPEGYEPKEWEYHQSPIKRWFAKYVYEEPEKAYERTLHFLNIRAEQRYWKQLENKVRALQKDRQDYKGWYYVGIDKSIVDDNRTAIEYKEKFSKGSR